jgi:hypothetical protein
MAGDEALRLASELAVGRDAGTGRTRPKPNPKAELEPRTSGLEETVQGLTRLLSRATMGEIRPLRRSLERLARQLDELLDDAFYAEEAVGGAHGGGRRLSPPRS